MTITFIFWTCHSVSQR